MPVSVKETSNHATQLLDLPDYLAITSHRKVLITLGQE